MRLLLVLIGLCLALYGFVGVLLLGGINDERFHVIAVWPVRCWRWSYYLAAERLSVYGWPAGRWCAETPARPPRSGIARSHRRHGVDV